VRVVVRFDLIFLAVAFAAASSHAFSISEVGGETAASTARADLRDTEGMYLVPAGDYRPFFKRSDGALTISVAAFHLDAAPITKAQYLEFVRSHPVWRRSQVKALAAEHAYLTDWRDDLDPGGDLDEPVTFVSWFAARAYCSEHGRLPTVAEWERSAGANHIGATTAGRAPFQFAMGKSSSDISELPFQFGEVWEWTEDFNSAPVTGVGETSRTDTPKFCGDGIRSNNAADYGAFLRYSFRSSLRGNYTLKNLGFRCAR
jgi:formylglycine-generating enzyme